MHYSRLIVFILGCLWVAGCTKYTPPGRPQPYLGPTESMADVVAQINRNTAPLRTLWARHSFEATVVDERGKSFFVNGDGNLLFRKPRELRLIGNKDIAGTIFEAGSTDDRFWLKVLPEADTMWWGYHVNVGKPCALDVPIRPDALVEVLGISDIDQTFSTEPQPVMRFNNDSDAYMFLWTQPSGSRRVPVREVWYDRATKLPKLVLFFDTEGRVVVRAYLAKHAPVQIDSSTPAPRRSEAADRLAEDPQLRSGVAQSPRVTPDSARVTPDSPRVTPDSPRVATDIKLLFPQTGTRMNLELRDLMLQRNGVPNDRSIRFPTGDDVRTIIQIDKDCPQ